MRMVNPLDYAYVATAIIGLVFYVAFRSGRASIARYLGAVILSIVALATTAVAVVVFVFGVGVYQNGHSVGLLIAGFGLLFGLLALTLWGLFIGLVESPYVIEPPEVKEQRLRGRRMAARLLTGVLLAAGIAFSLWKREQPSHAAEIVEVSLSFDESGAVSRDAKGTAKRWSLPSGRYLGKVDGPTFGREVSRLRTGPGVALLVETSGASEFFEPGAEHREQWFGRERAAMFTPRGDVVFLAEDRCVAWSVMPKVWKPVRRYCGRATGIDLAADDSGAVHLLARSGDVITIDGDPPSVRREVKGRGRRWTRILGEASGTIVVVDDDGRGGVALSGETEIRELPESVRLPAFGLLGRTTLVFGASDLRVIDLVSLRESAYADGPVAALAASSRHGRTLVARGMDLFMIGPDASEPRTERLRPWSLPAPTPLFAGSR